MNWGQYYETGCSAADVINKFQYRITTVIDKLDKQISGTIYRPYLAANEAEGLEEVKCLIGCRLPPLDGYTSVCLVLTIDVYGYDKLKMCFFAANVTG